MLDNSFIKLRQAKPAQTRNKDALWRFILSFFLWIRRKEAVVTCGINPASNGTPMISEVANSIQKSTDGTRITAFFIKTLLMLLRLRLFICYNFFSHATNSA